MSLLYLINLYILRMTLQHHWNQKYNGQFERLSQKNLNKSTRNSISHNPAKVNSVMVSVIYLTLQHIA